MAWVPGGIFIYRACMHSAQSAQESDDRMLEFLTGMGFTDIGEEEDEDAAPVAVAVAFDDGKQRQQHLPGERPVSGWTARLMRLFGWWVQHISTVPGAAVVTEAE